MWRRAAHLRGMISTAFGVALVAIMGLATLHAGTLGAQATTPRSAQPGVTSRDSVVTDTVAAEARTVAGRVLKPRRRGADSVESMPVRGVLVTLHRIGRDAAGALDSMRTDAAGRYRFDYMTRGADAVYFTSVTYGGIAYFTPPLRATTVTDDAADITVFDTISTRFPLTVRGRHLIVGDIDSSNMRTVIEVFELENDSMKTLVSDDTTSGRPTWSIAVPHAARELRMNDMEVSSDAFVQRPGRVELYAPFAPGLKQVSFSYRMAASDFPVTFSNEYDVDVFEVLLEESRGVVVNEHIASVANVNLEGRTFRRFLGQDVAADETVLLDLPASKPLGRSGYIAALLIAIGAAMLLVLSRAMSRRPVQPVRVSVATATAPELPLQERLAREIAALDAVFERTPNPSSDVRDAYERRRAELKDALAGALADAGNTR